MSVIIDAHHHLWDTRTLHYPLFDTIRALQGRYGIEEYERTARTYGISASVNVEVASAGAEPRQETSWVVQETARSPVVKRLVVWAPVERPQLGTYLDWINSLDDPRITGIRRSFEFEPPDFPRRPEVIAGIRSLGTRGLTFDLVLFQDSLPAVVHLAKACPEVQFVLDHLGKPNLREGVAPTWYRSMRELAALPNVACKISGLVTEADYARWTRDEIQPYIHEVVERFGWDRVMFGSDWPVCNLAGGLERWMEAVQWCLAGVSTAEADTFWRGTAQRIYCMSRGTPDSRQGWQEETMGIV